LIGQLLGIHQITAQARRPDDLSDVLPKRRICDIIIVMDKNR